jgi:hypothetical protein
VRALVAATVLAGCGGEPPTAARQALGAVESGVWSQSVGGALNELPALAGATLSWDATRNQLVLFGGYGNGLYYNDVYTAPPSFWSLRVCTGACTPPPGRRNHAAAFDVTRGVLVIYGGNDAGATPFDDTWEWNGTLWTERCTGCAPGHRTAAAMAWDPVLGHTILFGGLSSATAKGDTWQWDGTNWTQLTPATSPPARIGAALTTDTVRSRVLLFGGADASVSTATNDTWEWDGATWTQLCPSCNPTPLPRWRTGLAFDPIRRRAIMFGSSSDNSTWEWDGATWTPTASSGPTPRDFPSMAWSPLEQSVVLFGGSAGIFTTFDDTWEYRGRGGPCRSAADCDSPLSCVDGVCCDGACMICQRCNTPGSSGSCLPVLNAVDPDTCAGAQTCDATGTCKLQNGQACGGAGDCASGFCAGGLCCNRACSLACETCNPVGGAGTCVTAPAGAVAAACGAYRCNGANADCPIACAADGDCAPGFYCNAGACSTSLPLGMACAVDRSCQSGHCVDGVCCDSACTGRCQYCGSGTCAVAVGSDPRGDCAGDPSCGGTCQADGSCLYPGAEAACDVCKVCNGSGRCNQPPRSGDDARCGAVSCAALSSECRTFGDVERRCVDVGLCAQPNDPAACTSSSPAPDGTPCTGGVCDQGACRPSPPDAGRGTGPSGGGCAVGGASGSPCMLLLLGAMLAAARRRRRRFRSAPSERGGGA